MGQSRVICGYHFQSDVDAARIVASAVVARLHANDAFVKQLNKAKDEFSKLQKQDSFSLFPKIIPYNLTINRNYLM